MSIKKIASLLLALTVFIGATGCRPNTASVAKKFVGTVISFDIPLRKIFNNTLQDCGNISTDAAVKYVIHYDSTDCVTCKIKLLKSYDILKSSDCNDSIESIPIILFSIPENYIDELMKELKFLDLDFPIYIDYTNSFCDINPQIPNDKRFHSFLLDIENKVSLVGDPMLNPSILKLYNSILDNMLAHDGVYVPEGTEN